MKHPALEPLRLKNTMLPNRAVVAPMSRVSTHGDGVATSNMATYYADFARGGFGLIIGEGTYTDTRFSIGYARQPGLVNDAQEAGWAKVVDAVHRHGGHMIAQLMHAGALSQTLPEPAGPSAIQPLRRMMPEYGGSGPWPVPKAMTQDHIAEAVDGFADSALRAERAGFVGVEIHAANGYLIDQFLSASTNHRSDAYGGPLEQRVRLATETIEAVKKVVSPDFIVGIRLSQGKVNDFDYRWPGGADDARLLFDAVARAGADYIHLASEGKGWRHAAVLADGTSLTALARHRTGLPVIANGGLHDPEMARWILTEGHADLISLGTAALTNPDWPEKLRQNSPLVPFDHHMLSPMATIEAGWAWLAQSREGSR